MGLFDFIKKKSEESSIKDERQKNFADEVRADADALVEQFKTYCNLDYSVSSLHLLDRILDQTADYYNTQMDYETQKRTIKKSASYIFEVAKQNFGGKYLWYEQLNQPVLVTGQPDFDVSLIAYEKVKGRLENGIEDNIPFFFEGYIQAVQRKASAMII